MKYITTFLLVVLVGCTAMYGTDSWKYEFPFMVSSEKQILNSRFVIKTIKDKHLPRITT